MIRSTYRIDIESSDRITITLSATLPKNARSAAHAAAMLAERLGMARADLARLDDWHPDRPTADTETLDALDELFPMRSGHIAATGATTSRASLSGGG